MDPFNGRPSQFRTFFFHSIYIVYLESHRNQDIEMISNYFRLNHCLHMKNKNYEMIDITFLAW